MLMYSLDIREKQVVLFLFKTRLVGMFGYFK